jgi:cellulose synthase/poly-beta-1,6-N-acetylglucosamine synthase-like glycosyltransferase
MLIVPILIAAFAVAYVYFLYPSLVVLAARLLPAEPELPPAPTMPSVSVVIPAHNEEPVIAAKIANCLALEYPRDRIEIVIVSDGSTDGTVQEARRVAVEPVRILEFSQRRGKTAVLNEVIPALRGEIVVQTDANSSLAADAIIEIVRPFADRATGCVVGQLVLTNVEDPRVSAGEGLYWSYENRLKMAESRLGVLITANGGIYALRRSLFEPLPLHIAGDAADPLLIASRGYRVRFQPSAVAREKAAESLLEEFGRKVRIITQGFSAFAYVRGMLVPPQPRMAFALFSHKFLRWLLPWFLLTLLGLCLVPQAPPWARIFGALQALFYAMGILGLLGGERIRKIRPVGVAAYFCVANAAAALAALKVLGGRRYPTWEKSASSR